MKTSGNAHVSVGDGVVTVKREGSSTLALANVLGVVPDGKFERIYLDRLVHRLDETELGRFAVAGAISTVLIRPKGQQ